MTFPGPPDSAGTLAFARQLSLFRDYLQRVACREWMGAHIDGERSQAPEELGAIAAAFLAMLNSLEGGAAPDVAVRAAVDTYTSMSALHDRTEAASRERLKAREERMLATVCPYCGAAPGDRCMSDGEVPKVMYTFHRDRERQAMQAQR